MDHNPPHADHGRKCLPSSYIIIFYLPNIYMQISPYVTLAWSSAVPWLNHLGNIISSSVVTSMGQQRHCAIAKLTRLPHLATTNIISAVPSPT
jgi:hypothetical protein